MLKKNKNTAPFIFLPEVAGEGNQQHCSERSQPGTKPNPELHTFTWQGFLLRQGHTSYTQLRLSPHIQRVLGTNTHTFGSLKEYVEA